MNIDCDWCICGKRALDGKLYCSYECQIKDAASIASSTTATPSASSSLSSSSASSFISSATMVNNSSISLNYNTTNAYNVINLNLPRHNVPPQAWDPFRRRYSLPAVLHQSYNKINNLNQMTALNNNYKNINSNNTTNSNSYINNNYNSNNNNSNSNNTNNITNFNNKTTFNTTLKNVHRFLNRSNSCYAFYNRNSNSTTLINQPPIIHTTTTTTSYYSNNKNNNNTSNGTLMNNANNNNNNNNSFITSNIYQQHRCNAYNYNYKRSSEDLTRSFYDDTQNQNNFVHDNVYLKKEPIIVINLTSEKNSIKEINKKELNCNKFRNDNSVEINKKSDKNDFKTAEPEKINDSQLAKENDKNNTILLGSYLAANTFTSNSLITNALSRRSSITATSTINTTATNVIASTTYTTISMNRHPLSPETDDKLFEKKMGEKNRNNSLEEFLKKSSLLNKECKIKDKNSDIYSKLFSFSYKKFFMRRNLGSNHKSKLHDDENNFDDEETRTSDHNNESNLNKKDHCFGLSGENKKECSKEKHKKGDKRSNYGILNSFLREKRKNNTDSKISNSDETPPNIYPKRKESNPQNIVYKNNKRNIMNNQNYMDNEINEMNNSFVDHPKYLIDDKDNSSIDHSLLIDDDDICNNSVLFSDTKTFHDSNSHDNDFDLMTTFPMDSTIADSNEYEKKSENKSNYNVLGKSNSLDCFQCQEPLPIEDISKNVNDLSLNSSSFKGINFSFDKFIERNKEDDMYRINKNFRFGYNDDDQLCLNDYYYDGNEEVLDKRQFYRKETKYDKQYNEKNSSKTTTTTFANSIIKSKATSTTNTTFTTTTCHSINTKCHNNITLNNITYDNINTKLYSNTIQRKNSNSNININNKDNNNKDVLNSFDISYDPFKEMSIKSCGNQQPVVNKMSEEVIYNSDNDILNKVTVINEHHSLNRQSCDFECNSILSDNNESGMEMKIDENEQQEYENSFDDIRDKILHLNSVDSNTKIYQNNSPSVRIIFYSTPDTKNFSYGIINMNRDNNDNDNNDNCIIDDDYDTTIYDCGNSYGITNGELFTNTTKTKSNQNQHDKTTKCHHRKSMVKNPLENNRNLNHRCREPYKYNWLPNYLKDDDFDDMDSLYL